MSGDFKTLDTEAAIFKKITSQKWWKLFCEDKDLYIDIRKDNYINVYYYGGSLAKIEYYKDEFVTTISKKYLGINEKGEIKRNSLILKELTKDKIKEIKARIKNIYLKEKDTNSKAKEKKIQGILVLKGQEIYIDSELQYNKSEKNARIDLIALSSEGVLSFVELKLIRNTELNPKEPSSPTDKGIINQIKKYKKFITNYEKYLTAYYEKIIRLKNDLGIFNPKRDFKIHKINKNPKLIIAITKELSPGLEGRMIRIKTFLEKHQIDFDFIKINSKI